jgi:multimeric flavodoxin WrbA
MKLLGIYGSPRKKGNTDQLLDKALEGARNVGAETRAIYARDLEMCGCIECGGCDETGKCVVQDDMQLVYPHLEEADAIILASPIFFYNVTAQVKSVIDRCQANWCGRFLRKSAEERKSYDSGKGYLIAVAASKGKKLFDCAELTAKYFFDALDMSYEEGLLFRGLEKRKDAQEDSQSLEAAFRFGEKAATQADPANLKMPSKGP